MTQVIAAFSTRFFQQVDVRDFNSLIECLAHVVNRESGTGDRDQRFHLHACLRRGGGPGLELYSMFAQRGGDVCVGWGDRKGKEVTSVGGAWVAGSGERGELVA